MGINYALLRNVSAREIISALVRDGFAWDRGDGSHQIYYRSDGRRVTVTFHGAGRTFSRKTLVSMIKQTGWTEEDVKRLKLIWSLPRLQCPDRLSRRPRVARALIYGKIFLNAAPVINFCPPAPERAIESYSTAASTTTRT